jgi:hypothetical protein
MGIEDMFDVFEDKGRRRDRGYDYGHDRGDPIRRSEEGQNRGYYDREDEDDLMIGKLKEAAGKVRKNKVLLAVVIIGGAVLLCAGLWLLSVVVGIIDKHGIKGLLDMSNGPLKWLWEGSGK